MSTTTATKKIRRASKRANLDHIAADLRGLAVHVDDLLLDPNNANQHSKASLERIEASLEVYGQRTPLVVQTSTRVVRKGNGTLAAARNAKWKWIAVVSEDDTDFRATGYALSDNRSAEFSIWDDAVLADQLNELQANDDAELGLLAMTGFDDDSLAELLKAVATIDAPLDFGGPTDPILGGLSSYKIIVDCRNEKHQAKLLDKFVEIGIKCKALTA